MQRVYLGCLSIAFSVCLIATPTTYADGSYAPIPAGPVISDPLPEMALTLEDLTHSDSDVTGLAAFVFAHEQGFLHLLTRTQELERIVSEPVQRRSGLLIKGTLNIVSLPR
jgi:hypothetical protein